MASWEKAGKSRRVGRQLGEIPAAKTEIGAAGKEYGVNMAVKLELQRAWVVFWDVFDLTVVLCTLNYHDNPGGTFVPESEHVFRNLSFHNQFRREWEGLEFPTERGVNKDQTGAVEVDNFTRSY